MEQIEQNRHDKIVIALDVATRKSGMAISFNDKIVALAPIHLNDKMQFSGAKITTDLHTLQTFFNELPIDLQAMQKWGQPEVEILVERSQHDVYNLAQKLNLYVGLYLGVLSNWLALQNLLISNVKMLPPREWQLHAFGSAEIDRATGKQMSLERANAWLAANGYEHQIDSDDVADALNILLLNEYLRDEQTIRLEKQGRMENKVSLKKQLQVVETKILQLQQQALIKQQSQLNKLLTTKKYYGDPTELKAKQTALKSQDWTTFLNQKQLEQLNNLEQKRQVLIEQQQANRQNVILKTGGLRG